ncbi:hypothetical protein DIPPA_08551 [Diplonema papillatum]|nr:hypothetical protein DIPPA_08551 [Diplonema papillatum]
MKRAHALAFVVLMATGGMQRVLTDVRRAAGGPAESGGDTCAAEEGGAACRDDTRNRSVRRAAAGGGAAAAAVERPWRRKNPHVAGVLASESSILRGVLADVRRAAGGPAECGGNTCAAEEGGAACRDDTRNRSVRRAAAGGGAAAAAVERPWRRKNPHVAGVLASEFDPTSDEGRLFSLSSVETMEQLLHGRRADAGGGFEMSWLRRRAHALAFIVLMAAGGVLTDVRRAAGGPAESGGDTCAAEEGGAACRDDTRNRSVRRAAAGGGAAAAAVERPWRRKNPHVAGVLASEFDPTSDEGRLFSLSSVETMEQLLHGRRADAGGGFEMSWLAPNQESRKHKNLHSRFSKKDDAKRAHALAFIVLMAAGGVLADVRRAAGGPAESGGDTCAAEEGGAACRDDTRNRSVRRAAAGGGAAAAAVERPWRRKNPHVAGVLASEFDPTSDEGRLFSLSSVETMEQLLHGRRADAGGGFEMSWLAPTAPAKHPSDGGTVETTLTSILREWLGSVQTYAGMRELRASVIGAGDLLGLPLQLLSDRFARVSLSDVGFGVTQGALQSGPEDLPGKVSYFKEDVTGLLPSFRWKCEYLFGVVDNPEQAFEVISEYIESDSFFPAHLTHDTPYNSSLRHVPSGDVVIVNLLFHTLGESFLSHLTHELTRLKAARWPSIPDAGASLGPAAAALHRKLTRHVARRVAEKMTRNPNRKLLVLLSPLLQREVAAEGPEGGGGAGHPGRVLRRWGGDEDVVEYFEGLDGAAVVHRSEATMVGARWTKGGKAYLREDTVAITALSYGEELSMEAWLELARSGNSAMWTG